MFRNYLKTALRNLARNRGYTIINILGLTVGIAACLLIFLVIRFETSFDRFHSKKNNIYRVSSAFHGEDGISYSPGVPFPTAPALRIDFPQIKEIASILKTDDNQITLINDGTTPPKKFTEDVYFAEPEFFKLFDFPWIAGDPASTLSMPGHAAITQELAEKYYGDWKNAIGKTFLRKNKESFTISGIIKDPPLNSDFPINIVVSYASIKNTNLKRNLDDWVSTFSSAYTFVNLPDDYPLEKFNNDLAGFVKKHKPAEYQRDKYVAQPLAAMHFDDRFGNYREHTFSKSLITALILIGIFLIIIACVNFINLATAQAVNRSKEVGVRKVLGGNRRQLAFQFMSETALITFVSIFGAIGVAQLGLPFINKLLQLHMSVDFINQPSLLLFLLLVGVVVTFLSGIYPALILAGFNPITALKSKVSPKMMGGISLRRGLVVLQFAIAHILIIGTLIVVGQMNFFRKAALGFEKAAIVNVPLPTDSISRSKVDVLRNQLLQNTDITNASFSYASPAADGNWQSDFKFDKSTKSTNWSANLKWADVNYFKTYNLQFVAGRPYYPADTVRELVVNETFLRKLGITDPEQAIGKEVNFWDGYMVAPIVGVVRDFNSFSLREPMAPVVLGTLKSTYQTISIRIKTGKEKATLAYVENLWNKTFPDYIYEHTFLDETIANFYRQENQLSMLYKIFAGIAILISCLGLYGLVSFMAVQRTKEVGIRKVLGATARNIVYLLSKEFSLLILIAFVIAGPIAWWIMTNWLNNYTYRIKIGGSIFLLAIAGSLIIAWITVGHRAIKAALANPVKSLRTE